MNTNILAIDVSLAGISGDMFLAALLDLYSKVYSEEKCEELLIEFVNLLNRDLSEAVDIVLEHTSYHDFKGKKLSLVNFTQKISIGDINIIMLKLFEFYNVKENIKNMGVSVFSVILEAEKEVHQGEVLHLHELGTVDTILDIVLSMILIDKLNINKVLISPVALGQGIVNTEHGKLPVPTPATDKIIQKYQIRTVAGPRGGEATTPTGMALIAAMNKYLDTAQNTIWSLSSLGFGNRSWEDRGNYLRLRLGKIVETDTSISLLETNIDDISGEILGQTMNELFKAGALDVSYIPIFMKKNRPAYCLRVIVKNSDAELIAEKIQEHTGTLGVRIFEINRHIGKRSFSHEKLMLMGKKIDFIVKHGKYNRKIEFDDLKRLSEELDIPIIKLQNLINKELDY